MFDANNFGGDLRSKASRRSAGRFPDVDALADRLDRRAEALQVSDPFKQEPAREHHHSTPDLDL